MSKTGGGVGTNQHQIKGQGKVKQPTTCAASVDSLQRQCQTAPDDDPMMEHLLDAALIYIDDGENEFFDETHHSASFTPEAQRRLSQDFQKFCTAQQYYLASYMDQTGKDLSDVAYNYIMNRQGRSDGFLDGWTEDGEIEVCHAAEKLADAASQEYPLRIVIKDNLDELSLTCYKDEVLRVWLQQPRL